MLERFKLLVYVLPNSSVSMPFVAMDTLCFPLKPPWIASVLRHRAGRIAKLLEQIPVSFALFARYP